MLQAWFESRGMRCITTAIREFRMGHEDVAAFLVKHEPSVVVFDIGLPYEPNWDFVQVLRQIPEIGRVPIVVTTTNKVVLERLVGPTDAFEIVGKPYDLDALADAVLAAAANGGSR